MLNSKQWFKKSTYRDTYREVLHFQKCLLFLCPSLSFSLSPVALTLSCFVVLSAAWKYSLVLLQGETVWCSCSESLSNWPCPCCSLTTSNHTQLHTQDSQLLPWMPCLDWPFTCFHLCFIFSIWYPSATVEKHYWTFFFFYLTLSVHF